MFRYASFKGLGSLLGTILFMCGTVSASDLELPDLEFKPELIQQTKAWAHDAKVEIERGLEFIKRQPIERKEGYYREVIDGLLRDSRGENESLMRFILHRAVVVHNALLEVPYSPKRNATTRRLLSESLEMALSVYQKDVSIFEQLEKKKTYERSIDFAVLSLRWAEFMLNLHYQLPTNHSRLQIMRQTLLIWMNDMAKDVQWNRQLAPVTDRMAMFYQRIRHEDPADNGRKLALTREIRTFLETELRIAYGILGIKMEETAPLLEINDGHPRYGVSFSIGMLSYFKEIRDNEELYEYCMSVNTLSQTDSIQVSIAGKPSLQVKRGYYDYPIYTKDFICAVVASLASNQGLPPKYKDLIVVIATIGIDDGEVYKFYGHNKEDLLNHCHNKLKSARSSSVLGFTVTTKTDSFYYQLRRGRHDPNWQTAIEYCSSIGSTVK